MTKAFKFPKELGACADLVYKLRNKRLEMEKAVELVKTEETALKNYIIEVLPKSQASGVAGKFARVTVSNKDIPQVKDWVAFYKYIKKTGSFDLMQRRLSGGAVKERLESGVKLPGVEMFHIPTVSINKV